MREYTNQVVQENITFPENMKKLTSSSAVKRKKVNSVPQCRPTNS